MTLAARLIHRCAIERDANLGVTVGDAGYAAEADWQPYQVNVPCFFWPRPSFRGGGEVVETDRQFVMADFKMLLPATAGVVERDRVRAVTDRVGRSIEPGPFDVTGVNPHDPEHVLLLLQEVRSGLPV